jgi:hypothetical protein
MPSIDLVRVKRLFQDHVSVANDQDAIDGERSLMDRVDHLGQHLGVDALLFGR